MTETMSRITTMLAVLATTMFAIASAHAQTPPEQPGGEAQPADPYAEPAPPPEGPQPPPPAADPPPTPPAEALPAPSEPAPLAIDKPVDHPALLLPRVFNAPTARILPGAVFFSSTGIDTSGGFSSDMRVGLGDVAEFGLSLADQIRSREPGTTDRERVYPYVLASFRMGVPEHRLFHHQPALAVGFRKSFESEDAGFTSRVAELYVVASKSLFYDKLSLHAGATFWDAELEDPAGNVAFLHDSDVRRQLRGFGGLEVEALDDAYIMAEWTYWPELEYADNPTDRNIDLVAQLAWGVRYHVARAVFLEAGVRVDDIADANLIDAQIFGQFTFASFRMRDWIAGLR